MEFVIESFRADWEALLHFVPQLVYAAVVLIVFTWGSVIAGRITTGMMHRSVRFRTNERFLQLLVSLTISLTGVLVALGVLGFDGVAASLLATGGVVAIVLGFAFREIGENFLAGFFLSFSRPFELGDLIRTGDLTGTVRAIELRHVHVRTFDGCDVYVPSAQIFSEALYNYTGDGLRRPGFTIGVAYGDDPARVVDLLEAAARGVPDVITEPAPWVSIQAFSAQHVDYEVVFWVDVTLSNRSLGAVHNEVKTRCWTALRDAGATFSCDVSSGIDVLSVPGVSVALSGDAAATGAGAA